MCKMRHIIDGRQKTADACGGTETELNTSPVTFSMNQSTALCLPVLSESQKLVWVRSNQIDTQLGCTAELDRAFDRFPYLTQKETAALAQRCSLHPDQVKVWFMVQRLRYGISWDYKDIREIQRKFKASRGKAQRKQDLQDGREVKEKRGEKKKKKREVKQSDGKKAGKVRGEVNEGRMIGENVRTDKRLEKKTEQPMNKEKDRKIEVDERNRQKKQKSTAVTDTMRKKRMKQDSHGTVERVGEEQQSIQLETTGPTTQRKEKANRLMSFNVWPVDKSFVVPGESLDVSPLLFNVPPLSDIQTEVLKGADVVAPPTPNSGMAPVNSGSEGKLEGETSPKREEHVDLAYNSVFVTDVDKLRELMNINPIEDSSSTFNPQQHSHVIDACTLHSPIHCNTKSKTQLKMMKMAFSRCQYPNSEDYDRMARLIDIPRYMLVKWFGDMRYYIKKIKPSWMNQEQHRQALANIRRLQRRNPQVKVKCSEGSRKRTREDPVRESSGKDKSVKVPPEKKLQLISH